MTFVSRVASAILLIAIVFVTLSPIQDRPQLGHPDVERAGAYLLLGIALGFGFPRHARYTVPLVVFLSVVLEARSTSFRGGMAGSTICS